MLLRLLHLAQAGLTLYGAAQSQAAIQNLLKYEDATKKAAKISSEAGRQLYRTRTTQAAGAGALFFSLFASVMLLMRGPSYGFLVRYLAAPVVALAVFAAKIHVQDFWTVKGDGKTVSPKVPLPKLEGYNEALEKTQELLNTLGLLAISWVGASFLTLVVGY